MEICAGQTQPVRVYRAASPQTAAIGLSTAEPPSPQQAAEARGDFETAFSLYARQLEQEPGSARLILCKGYCAAMLSSPQANRVREFTACLSQCLSGGAANDTALTALIHDRITRVDAYVRLMAVNSTGAMANIYQVERAHLAGWAWLARQQRPEERENVLRTAESAMRGIAVNVVRSTRGIRARGELMRTFQGLLLANLAFCGLERDPELRLQLDRICEEVNLLKPGR